MKYLLVYSYTVTVTHTVYTNRPMDDCVAYDSISGEYLLTFIHADHEGNLTAQIADEKYSFTPDNLRDLLSEFGINIPLDKRIVIFPCYPQTVRKRYARDLVQNRIIVQGDWNVITGIGSRITDTQAVILVGKVVNDQKETPL